MKRIPWIQVLRWIFLIGLLWWGGHQAYSMRDELGQIKGPLSAVPLMVISVVFTQWVQGRMSQHLIRFCDRDISLMKAFHLNVIAGLWGTLFPLGSIGYKAAFFKKELNLSLQTYAANYGLALLATLFMGSILGGVSLILLQRPNYALLCFSVGICVVALITWAPSFLRWASSKVGHPDWFSLGPKILLRRLLIISRIQAMGLFGYTGLYLGCFILVGHHPTPLIVMVMVVAQSWMFLAPIVPGNLVLLEGIGAWWMLKNGIPVPDSITSVALMRISFLALLLLLAPWCQFQLSRSTSQKSAA